MNLNEEFSKKEDKLTNLIAETENFELMDCFNEWMELRNQLNEKSLTEIIEIIDNDQSRKE